MRGVESYKMADFPPPVTFSVFDLGTSNQISDHAATSDEYS